MTYLPYSLTTKTTDKKIIMEWKTLFCIYYTVQKSFVYMKQMCTFVRESRHDVYSVSCSGLIDRKCP